MIWLRSAAFQVAFHLTTIVLLLAGVAVVVLAPHHALAYARLWARVTLWLARALCGIDWRVAGPGALPEGAALIASRHESAFDTFVWLLLLPHCTYVTKAELFRVPMLGGLMRSAGMIRVDRAAGAAALRRLADDVARALSGGRQVVIFPEGTRVPREAPVRLQPGIALLAQRAAAPVVPVATDSGAFWPRRSFLRRPGTITIRIGAPLPTGLARAELAVVLQRELDLRLVDNFVN